jgi:Flp pilus assembly protein TadG
MVVRQAGRAIRRAVGRAEGSAIAEFAMVAPILFMMFFAVFWFGQAFRIYTTINHAARLGARSAVAPVCATCAAGNDPAQNAYNAVQAALVAARMDPTNLQRPTNRPSLCRCGNPNTLCTGFGQVSCANTQASICVQGAQQVGAGGPVTETDVNLSPAGPGTGTGVCGISVSFQYPFKFTLPGTSLNMQTINLPAQAEMRSENH